MKQLVLFFLLLPLSMIAQLNTLYVQGDVVNIRSAPNAQGAVVAKAKRLERLDVLQQSAQDIVGGVTDNWYQVRTPSGKTGYVFGNFTSLKREGQKTEILVLTEMFFGDCLHLVFGDHSFGLADNNFGQVDDLIDDADSDAPKYVGRKFRVTYNDLYTIHYEACNSDLPGELIKTETIVNLQLID
jgi:uncharacterized protein YgiM (DUF1202 family)